MGQQTPRAPRIAILGLHLEANAFAPITVKEDFARQCLERGQAISRLARQPVSHLPSESQGFYKRMDDTGPGVPVQILVMAAPPGGPIDQSLLNDAFDEMRAGLAAALPLDGVYIANHGASSATGDEDSDGTMAAMLRAIVGPVVPILCTHDLHCNISEKLIGAVDAFIGYRTNPHVDMRERAADAADLLREAMGGERFARGFVRLPITPPSVSLLTARGPYADRMAECEALMARDPRIANASICGGFVFSDLPKCGMTVIVTARGGGQALADAAAQEIARATWADRQRYVANLSSLADVTARAKAAGEGAAPVLIADVADNPGGGGRGNTAYVLRALHEAGVAGVVLANFVDPDLATEAYRLGEGARFTATFNRNPSEFSATFSAPARIVQLSDGKGIGRRGTMAGRAFDLGPAALLELEGSGIRVVLASLRRQCHEPRMIEMFGVDIAAARVVVVKSRGHFRAGFDEFFPDERILEVDVPGLTSPVLVNFPWKRLPRPVFPIDPGAGWSGAA